MIAQREIMVHFSIHYLSDIKILTKTFNSERNTPTKYFNTPEFIKIFPDFGIFVVELHYITSLMVLVHLRHVRATEGQSGISVDSLNFLNLGSG
jgi:hypothetical protein